MSSVGIRNRLVASATEALDAFGLVTFVATFGVSSTGSGAWLTCFAHEAQNKVKHVSKMS